MYWCLYEASALFCGANAEEFLDICCEGFYVECWGIVRGYNGTDDEFTRL